LHKEGNMLLVQAMSSFTVILDTRPGSTMVHAARNACSARSDFAGFGQDHSAGANSGSALMSSS
jgi:hypothetical protein